MRRLILLALLVVVLDARGQSLPQLDALGHGQETGLLPSWLSLDDNTSLEWSGGRLYGCFQDRATGNRWTSWSPALAPQRYMLDGLWRFSTPTPTTYADQRVCWPDLPAVTGPTALGEPAYWNIVCTGGCVDERIDWQAMNARAVAGTTVVGEACGAPLSGPPEAGKWFTLPRLQSPKGLQAVTRCKP